MNFDQIENKHMQGQKIESTDSEEWLKRSPFIKEDSETTEVASPKQISKFIIVKITINSRPIGKGNFFVQQQHEVSSIVELIKINRSSVYIIIRIFKNVKRISCLKKVGYRKSLLNAEEKHQIIVCVDDNFYCYDLTNECN